MALRGRAATAAAGAVAVIIFGLAVRGDLRPASWSSHESARDSTAGAPSRDRVDVDGTLQDDTRTISTEERDEALARAQVWRAPATPIAQAHLGPDPGQASTVDCRFAIARLGALTDAQLTDLFSGARFDKHDGLFTAPRPVSEWVRVFKQRVKILTDGPPCPA